jgi:hypothetical protein
VDRSDNVVVLDTEEPLAVARLCEDLLMAL